MFFHLILGLFSKAECLPGGSSLTGSLNLLLIRTLATLCLDTQMEKSLLI